MKWVVVLLLAGCTLSTGHEDASQTPGPVATEFDHPWSAMRIPAGSTAAWTWWDGALAGVAHFDIDGEGDTGDGWGLYFFDLAPDGLRFAGGGGQLPWTATTSVQGMVVDETAGAASGEAEHISVGAGEGHGVARILPRSADLHAGPLLVIAYAGGPGEALVGWAPAEALEQPFRTPEPMVDPRVLDSVPFNMSIGALLTLEMGSSLEARAGHHELFVRRSLGATTGAEEIEAALPDRQTLLVVSSLEMWGTAVSTAVGDAFGGMDVGPFVAQPDETPGCLPDLGPTNCVPYWGFRFEASGHGGGAVHIQTVHAASAMYETFAVAMSFDGLPHDLVPQAWYGLVDA